MSETAEIDQLLDQTLYLTQRIYEDPETPPTPLDLHSACAIGNYECVQDTISSGADINACNKGEGSGARGEGIGYVGGNGGWGCHKQEVVALIP